MSGGWEIGSKSLKLHGHRGPEAVHWSPPAVTSVRSGLIRVSFGLAGKEKLGKSWPRMLKNQPEMGSATRGAIILMTSHGRLSEDEFGVCVAEGAQIGAQTLISC